MRRLIRIILTVTVSLLLIILGTRSYLKYSVRHHIPQSTLAVVINQINSAPTLPDTLMRTYARVYPGIFDDNFTTDAFKSILGLKRGHRPSRQVASRYRSLLPYKTSGLPGKLSYLGFVWLLEDETSQEKCFEFIASRAEFTDSVTGIDRASQYFYHKTLGSLSLDEQLGLILKLRNPAYFDSERFPGRCDSAVKRLRERITRQTSG